MDNKPSFEIHDVANLIRDSRKIGMTIQEVARELGMSTRTVFRMIKTDRLKADRLFLPYGNEKKFIWVIDPMSIARIQVRKEIAEEEKKLKAKPKGSPRMTKKPALGDTQQ